MSGVLLNICFVAVAVSLVRMLIPDNRYQKQMSFLVACFFTASVVFYVTGADADLSGLAAEMKEAGRYVDFSEEVSRERASEIGKEISDSVRQVLEDEGISPEKIYVNVNISGLYSISISEIKLVLPRSSYGAYPDYEAYRDAAVRITAREVGAKITVTVEEN